MMNLLMFYTLSFKRPQKATDTEMTKDGIIRYKDKEIVGITILEASKKG